MSYMSIDSFGKCLNTVPKFPPHVLAIEGTHSPGGSQYEGDWIVRFQYSYISFKYFIPKFIQISIFRYFVRFSTFQYFDISISTF